MFLFPFLMVNLNNETEESNRVVVIKSENNIQKIPLNSSYRDTEIIVEVKGPIGINKVAIHNGKVWMKEAAESDPHKLCEKIGEIDSVGPRIACVPNNIVIWIEEIENN